MNIREPEKQFFDDFEHKVTGKIAKYEDRDNFPKLSDYGIERQDLDGYLFDKQAILDMEGSKRTQFTIAGIIMVLPLLVLSACPDSAYIWGKMPTTVAALALGLAFYLMIVKPIMKSIIYIRLQKMKDAKMEAYIKAVLFYQE